MKKFTFFIFIMSSLFVSNLFSQNNVIDKKEEIVNTAPEQAITEEMCKKFLGEENYKFINEIYDDKTVAIQKCKAEMLK